MNYNILKRSVKFMREKLNTAKKNIKSAVKKFNIIDILLIALIFLSLISLLYKLTWGSSEKYQSYEFVYICDSAPSELADSVSAKSKCADGDTGENLGEVIENVIADLLFRNPAITVIMRTLVASQHFFIISLLFHLPVQINI